MLRRPIRAAVVAAVVLHVLVGCGDTSGTSATDAATKEFENRKYGSTPSGPLASFFGYDDPEKMSATARERNKKMEQAVADCMRAEGFDYVVNTQATSFEMPDIDMTQREYAEKWGFGMTTVMSPDGSPIEDAPGMSGVQDPPTDPNEAIVAAMSESERRAYEIALYGQSMSEPMDAGDSGDSGDTEGGDGSDATDLGSDMPEGCQAKAYSSAMPDQDSDRLSKLWEQMSKRIEADKRIKAAVKDYRACMADAGYPKVKDVDDAYQAVNDRMTSLWNDGPSSPVTSVESGSDEPTTDGSGDGGSSDDGSGGGASVDGSGDDGSDPGSFGPAIDSKKLQEAQKFERKIAVADLGCRGPYQLVYEEVSAGYERDLISNHRTELEKARDAGGM